MSSATQGILESAERSKSERRQSVEADLFCESRLVGDLIDEYRFCQLAEVESGPSEDGLWLDRLMNQVDQSLNSVDEFVMSESACLARC